MQKYVFGLDLHPVTVHIKKIKNRIDAYPPEYYVLADQLQNYKNIHAVIAGIYVYFPNAGITVGNLGCFSAESYFNLEPHRPVRHEHDAVFTENSAGFIISESGGGKQLQYIKPLYYKGETAGYIAVTLNTDELLKYVTKTISSDTHYKAYGILLNGKAAGSTGSADMIRSGIAHTHTQHHKQLSDSGMITVPSSFFPNIRYVSFYSYTGILRPLYAAAGISTAAFFAICAAAIYLSYVIGLKNIQPFNRLLRQIGIDPFTEDDAVQAVSHKIDLLLNEKQSRITKLQAQQDMLNGLFLSDCIENPCTTETEAFERAQRYDVLFDFPFFTVCVIYNGTEPSDVSRQLLRFFRDRHLESVITHTDSCCTILFNLEKFTVPQIFSTLMKAVSDSIFSGKALIGIGLCYDNLTAVSQSYKEALWAITDPQRQEERQIVCYSQFDGADIYGYTDFQEALYAHDYADRKPAF